MQYRDYISNTDQVLSVHKLMHLEGAGAGVPYYSVDNGSGLSFDVLCGRALDIGALRFHGRLLSFLAACGVVHPAYYDARGRAWLRSFGGGFLTTCGLNQCGDPCELDGEEFGMHGRISNTPAQYVGSDVYGQDGVFCAEVHGEMRQTRHQGEHLVLRRRIQVQHGVNRILLTDTIQNRGAKPSPFMLLYHFNFGYPFLNPDCRIDIHNGSVLQTRGSFDLNDFPVPRADAEHQFALYGIDVSAACKTYATVYDPRSNAGVRFIYASKALPYLAVWKYPALNDYVMAVEPCNNHVRGAPWERENGTLRVLAPGETENIKLTLEFFDSWL